MSTQPPAVLTIAGSDSSGGAGIQADLKTFAAYECYGTSAITALTAQNTTGVQGVHPAPPAFVAQQIRSVLGDISVRAIKTGMLYDADITHAVVEALRGGFNGSLPPSLVCDPVCVATSGHSLLDPEAIDVLVTELFPLARLITPNKSEAELLLSHHGLPSGITSLEGMVAAAKNLAQFGSGAVLLKGGHVSATLGDVDRVSRADSTITVIRHGLLGDNMEILQVGVERTFPKRLVVDVLCEQGGVSLFVRPFIDSTSTHGTGCTLSAAIASELAHGKDLKKAVQNAVAYTHHGIETAYPIGAGHGPLNHFHSMSPRSIHRPTKDNRHPFTKKLIQGNAGEWKEYVEHEFVKLLGQGTLPRGPFIHFIKQDYIYLKYYARAYALLAAKSSTFTAIESATTTILNVISEIATHKSFCNTFGITNEELEDTPEAPATTAYGAYLIDVGLQGDSTKLLMALLACLLGYGEVGLWLKKQASLPNTWVHIEGNPYKKWMDDYGGEHYQGAVKLGLELIEARALQDPPSQMRFEEWRHVWERCTRLERGFWDAAMAAA
ncbi:Phosphomethylpyrimidine kinase-domain-containing protein [Collybia nuda]|uniref:Phosphomethylpyrimidine kinase-domain-containing protein n=1 Tax=Collybia nuda TaxID=64659 RepID=A0A9P6CCP1_9AGAR|nr:Phosphomethylpyrimidine kinase-domain-containing protein [Collybia nuda]